jgi:hypothetical protein
MVVYDAEMKAFTYFQKQNFISLLYTTISIKLIKWIYIFDKYCIFISLSYQKPYNKIYRVFHIKLELFK